MDLGIDFGTSYTKLGCLENGAFINLAGKDGYVPSVVTYLPSTGRLYFGHLALRLQEPGALTSRFFKLELKRNPAFRLGPYSLPEIMRSFFQFLAQEYISPLDKRIDRLILSVPNYFGLRARRLLADAAREATGAGDVYLLPEPVAALLGHNHLYSTQTLEGDILSIDIGGGTTDFSFLCLSGQGCRLLLETQFQIGNDAFSGSELDRGVLRNIFFPAFTMQTGNLIPNQFFSEKELSPRDRYKFNRLMQKAEAVRIELGQKDSIHCDIPDFYNGHSLIYNLEAEMFDTQLEPVFSRLSNYFVTNVKNRAESLGVFKSGRWNLDYVLLLGGASLTRGVAGMIAKLCPGVMVISPPEKDSAVVRGLCTWMDDELINQTTVRHIYPFNFYIEKKTGESETTALEKIPFDTANLELDINGIFPVFSFPIHSDYNLAASPENFHCRVYELTEEEDENQATGERFLGQDLALEIDLPCTLMEDTATLCLNLKQSRLELMGDEMQETKTNMITDWWLELPERQAAAAELLNEYPFIDKRLKHDFTQHLKQQATYKSYDATALYKMLYLIQILSGK